MILENFFHQSILNAFSIFLKRIRSIKYKIDSKFILLKIKFQNKNKFEYNTFRYKQELINLYSIYVFEHVFTSIATFLFLKFFSKTFDL